MCTQKNRLNETVLLSTKNICLNLSIRKYLQYYAKIYGPMCKSIYNCTAFINSWTWYDNESLVPKWGREQWSLIWCHPLPLLLHSCRTWPLLYTPSCWRTAATFLKKTKANFSWWHFVIYDSITVHVDVLKFLALVQDSKIALVRSYLLVLRLQGKRKF